MDFYFSTDIYPASNGYNIGSSNYLWNITANTVTLNNVVANGSLGVAGEVLTVGMPGTNNYWSNPTSACTFLTALLTVSDGSGNTIVANSSSLYIGNGSSNTVVNTSLVKIWSGTTGANVASLNAGTGQIHVGNSYNDVYANTSTLWFNVAGVTAASINTSIYTGTANNANNLGTQPAANFSNTSQITTMLGSYVLSTALTTSLGNYVLSTALTSLSYANTLQLSGNLGFYTNTAVLNANYPNNSQLSSNLSNYTTPASVAGLSANNATNFAGQGATFYVSNTYLQANFVANTYLQTNFVANTYLQPNFVSNSYLQSLGLTSGGTPSFSGNVVFNANVTINANLYANRINANSSLGVLGNFLTSGGPSSNAYWSTVSLPSSIASLYVSDTPPSSPTNGTLWYDSIGGELYLWYQPSGAGAWIIAVNQSFSTGNNPTSSFVNKFRNASFDLWQRGTGMSCNGTINSSNGLLGTYTADGWMFGSIGANCTINKVSGRLGNYPTRSAFQIVPASSVTGFCVYQRIESFIAVGMAAQTVTFQAWIYNNSGSSFTPQLTTNYPTTPDGFPTLTTDVVVNLQPCPNGVWTLVSYTFNASSNAWNGYQVYIYFPVAYSASCYVNISEPDIRVTTGYPIGLCSSPPSADIRPLSVELTLNQRYFEKSYDVGTVPGTVGIENNTVRGYWGGGTVSQTWSAGMMVQFRSTKAYTATLRTYSENTGTSGKIYDYNTAMDLSASMDPGTNDMMVWTTQTTASTGYNFIFNWVASAEL